MRGSRNRDGVGHGLRDRMGQQRTREEQQQLRERERVGETKEGKEWEGVCARMRRMYCARAAGVCVLEVEQLRSGVEWRRCSVRATVRATRATRNRGAVVPMCAQ